MRPGANQWQQPVYASTDSRYHVLELKPNFMKMPKLISFSVVALARV